MSLDRPTRVTLVVAAGILGWLVLAGGVALTETYSVVSVIGLVLVGVGWIGARALVRDVVERPAHEVDEYELVLRQRVRDLGYRTALIASVVLFVVLNVAVNLADRGSERLLSLAPELVALAMLPAAAGPSLLLAWRTRSVEDD
ncbi:hypothetical protein GCM10027425_04410 [Alteromonas gracilis]